MTLTVTQFARMGGKARWKKIPKKERSEMMRKLANLRPKKVPVDNGLAR